MLGLFLFNTFAYDLEGRVRSSLIKFTRLLNWEVQWHQGGGGGKKCREALKSQSEDKWFGAPSVRKEIHV